MQMQLLVKWVSQISFETNIPPDTPESYEERNNILVIWNSLTYLSAQKGPCEQIVIQDNISSLPVRSR